MATQRGQYRFNVGAGAPAWFAAQTDKTWVAVAGGPGFGSAFQNGARIDSVAASSQYGTFENLGIAWSGGWSIQSTGEFGQAADGGHATWHGNDIYAIGLRAAVPAWSRIKDPSPIGQIVSGDPPDINAPFDANSDGTPRTSHGWFNRVASASRIFTFRTADGGAAVPTTNCWSIDRNNLAAGWMYHGRAFANPGTSSFFFASGPSMWDPDTDTVWWAMEATAGTNGTVAVPVAAAVAAGNQSAAGPQIPGSSLYQAAQPSSPSPLADCPSALARINSTTKAWVALSPNYSRIYTFNPLQPTAGWVQRTPTGTAPPGFGRGMGAVYHAPSQALIIGGIAEGQSTGATVYKLNVPANPNSNGYSWQAISNGAGGVTPQNGNTGQFRGTFGKFRAIDDMGNGQTALVFYTVTNGPVYVYKMPAGALN